MDKSKLSNTLKVPVNMLKVTGILPKRKKSRFYKFRGICSWTVDITFYITLLIELRLNIVEQDYKNMTELISIMASFTSYILKMLIFCWNGKKVINVLNRLKDIIFIKYPIRCDIYLKNCIKYTTVLTRTFQFLIINMVILYSLKPFLSGSLAIRFASFGELGPWKIPYNMYEVFCIGVAGWNNSSIDILLICLISHGAVQFQILKDKLINIREWAGLSYKEIDAGIVICDLESINDEIDIKVNERLKECIQHHIAIIDYAAVLEEIYTYYFFAQFFNSVLAICNTWFQFILVDDLLIVPFLIVYTSALLVQLGMYCICCNNITLRSEEIRDACYMSNWHYCGPSVRKSLMIIMERAKRPTVLTAGKFSVLGLSSFTNLLRSCYSYFALMMELYKRQ